LRKEGDKPGFQDQELNMAFEFAKAQSESELTIVPVRLEEYEGSGYRLAIWPRYDLFLT